MEGRRIFAAIEVSGEARVRIADYIANLKRSFPNLLVGWERPEKLHITVKFAGNIGDAELVEFTAFADKAASTTDPFPITIANTGAFIKRRGTNVLWLGLQAPQIAKVAAPFEPVDQGRNRNFTPHLTIARLREPQNSRALIKRHLANNFEPIQFTAYELVIFESTLLPAGSVYKAVSRHPFRAAT